MSSGRPDGIRKEDSDQNIVSPARKPDDERTTWGEDFVADLEDYLGQHPLAAAVVAVVAGLLAHAGLSAPTQRPEAATPARPRPARKPDDERTTWGEGFLSDLEDYVGHHPLAAAVIAAVAGLLLHAVLSSPTEQPAMAKPARPRPARKPDGERTKWDEVFISGLEDYLGQHPFETATAVLGAGLLLRAALRSRTQRPEIAKPDEPQHRALRESLPERPLPAQPKSPAARPRTHHFGAADMEFTTHHPNGRNVEFRFAWKKRPVDAPEADWPTDEMGFTAVRPNGKHTAFTFKGKTRPIPDEKTAVGDSRPGLGWAKMEFKKSAPGRRDFKFRWSRTPPSAAPPASEPPAGTKPPGKPKPR